MLVSEFDYDLPEGLIAQLPHEKRENSRMLVLDKTKQQLFHNHFYDVVDYIEENTILVLNNTKVIPARLFGEKVNEDGSCGAKIEVFLLKEVEPKHWEVLIKPSKRVKVGTKILISEDLFAVVISKEEDEGKWKVAMFFQGNFYQILEKIGNIPLPPYIERKMSSDDIKKLDFERYQTVYAQKEGSVAAPTAGLHFSNEIIQKLQNKGVEIAYVTLNVGLGTFRPVKCKNILEHNMDSESFEIDEDNANKIINAKRKGKKLVAVGTTTVRTLETAFQQFGEIRRCYSSSKLFIYPPYEFKMIDGLITNFHLPKSTLLMLVSAFAGKEFVFDAYKSAIENKYRFYSYGDCMFIR